MKKEDAIKQVLSELEDTQLQHPTMRSMHQAYAVLLEEVDEVWTEIKKKPDQRHYIRVRQEAAQIAATALRIMIDLT